VGCSAEDVQGKRLDFFCMRRRMGTAEAPFASGCTCTGYNQFFKSESVFS
jgi:hypothetical protein